MGVKIKRIIELLEIEKECVLRNASAECNRYCAGCDLLHDDTELHEMYTEVIALLKAQEPRVMTLEEVKVSKGADMYLEISARTDDIPYITAATLDGVGTKGAVFYCSHFDFVAYNRRLYGWRCWTSRPDEKRREETPWEQ